ERRNPIGRLGRQRTAYLRTGDAIETRGSIGGDPRSRDARSPLFPLPRSRMRTERAQRPGDGISDRVVDIALERCGIDVGLPHRPRVLARRVPHEGIPQRTAFGRRVAIPDGAQEPRSPLGANSGSVRAEAEPTRSARDHLVTRAAELGDFDAKLARRPCTGEHAPSSEILRRELQDQLALALGEARQGAANDGYGSYESVECLPHPLSLARDVHE